MSSSRLPIWAYLLLVFAGGAGVGAFADRLYTAKVVSADTRISGPRTPDESRKRYIEELNKRLNLNASQITALSAVLEATQRKMRALHEREKPEMTAIHQEQVDKVHAILDDKQDLEYDKMRAEWERRRAAERR